MPHLLASSAILEDIQISPLRVLCDMNPTGWFQHISSYYLTDVQNFWTSDRNLPETVILS